MLFESRADDALAVITFPGDPTINAETFKHAFVKHMEASEVFMQLCNVYFGIHALQAQDLVHLLV